MKTLTINAKVLFSYDSDKITDLLGQYSRIILHAGVTTIIININKTNYVSFDGETLEFHFENEAKLFITKEGKIDYLGPDYGVGAYTIASATEEEQE